MDVGQRIKEARKRAGLTQKGLAEQIGAATGTIQQYELGKRQPRLEQLAKIAGALGTTLYELVGDDYFSSYSHEELVQMWKEVPFSDISARERVYTALDKLNDAGMEKAADIVELIAEVPRYKAGKVPAGDGKDTPTPPEGQNTTPPTDAEDG